MFISPGLPLCRAARWWADVVSQGHLGEAAQLGLSQAWFPALAFAQPSSALTFRRDAWRSHGSCLLPPQPKILVLTSEDLEKEWIQVEDITLERRRYFYSLFSKEAVDPTGIHDEIKKRRFETLGQLQADEVWMMINVTSLPGCLPKSEWDLVKIYGEEWQWSLLSLQPRNNPFYSVGHILDCCF